MPRNIENARSEVQWINDIVTGKNRIDPDGQGTGRRKNR